MTNQTQKDLEDLLEGENVDVNAAGVVGDEEDVEDVVEGQENELDDLGDEDDLHVTEKAEGEDLEVDEEVLSVVEDGETKVSTSIIENPFGMQTYGNSTSFLLFSFLFQLYTIR